VTPSFLPGRFSDSPACPEGTANFSSIFLAANLPLQGASDGKFLAKLSGDS
jgi:hypothetical protein